MFYAPHSILCDLKLRIKNVRICVVVSVGDRQIWRLFLLGVRDLTLQIRSSDCLI
jgi:hypothetical protein